MKLIDRSRYQVLLLPSVCSSELILKEHHLLVSLIGTWEDILINGLETTEIQGQWVEIFKLLKNRVESVGKKLRFINLSEPVKSALIQNAFDHPDVFSIGIAEALQDFKSKAGLTAKNNFIKAFIQTCPRVIYVQAQLLCKQGKISIKKGDLAVLPGVISGVVTVSSDDIYYAVILNFPEKTFLKVISRMLGEVFEELNQDIQDGAAEILNIIYGQVRAVLKENRSAATASIPRVLVGNRLNTLEFERRGTMEVSSGKMITIPFDTELGAFAIEVWMPSDFSGTF